MENHFPLSSIEPHFFDIILPSVRSCWRRDAVPKKTLKVTLGRFAVNWPIAPVAAHP